MLINEHEIFYDRRLHFCPDHFVKCKTFLNKDSYAWIINNLSGRYAFCHMSTYSDWISVTKQKNSYFCVPAFEDPGEATFYELAWS